VILGIIRNSVRTGAEGSIYLTAGYLNAKYHLRVISEQREPSLNVPHEGFRLPIRNPSHLVLFAQRTTPIKRLSDDTYDPPML